MKTLIGVIVLACVMGSLGDAEARYRRVRARGHVRAGGSGSVGLVLVPVGLYFGLGLLGTHILDQRGGDELLEDGGGLSLFAGWRLHHRLALEVGYSGTFHNPARVETIFGPDIDYLVLNGFTGDARVYLNEAPQSTEWYLQGGFGLYLLDSTYFGTEAVGTGLQLGGGVDFHVAPHIDLGLRALYRGISMRPPESIEDDTFVSAVSGEGSVSFHF